MKLKRYTAKWLDYYAAKREFDAKQKRSRTYHTNPKDEA